MVSEPTQPQPDAERRIQRSMYPLWQPTDWTPRQRRLALAGQLLLALACGWLTYTLVVWGRCGTPMVDPSRQLGTTLLCLGATLLTTAYWYAQRYACNVGSSEAGRVAAAAALLPLEGGVALLALAALVVQSVVRLAPTLLAYFPLTGGRRWLVLAQEAASDAASVAVGVSLLCSFLLGASLVNSNWRPQRDPLTLRSALGAPVVGGRRLLRRIMASMGKNSLLLLLIPLSLLDWFGISTPLPLAIGVLGGATAFFLLAFAAEVSGPARRQPQRQRT